MSCLAGVYSEEEISNVRVVSLLPVAGFFSQEPASVPGSGVDHSPRYRSSQSGWTRENVMSVKLYLRDTERIQGCRQWLFIHWNRAIKDIMRSRVSKWIIKTLKVYTWADRGLEDRVTAHEVRAVSASWAYNSQVALPDILSVAYWRSSGVFQNSYLRDMASVADGMSTLGHVVVAQQVVDPGHLHSPP